MRGELSAALASVNHLLQLKYYSHEVAALRSRIAEEMGHTHAVRHTIHTTHSRATRGKGLQGKARGPSAKHQIHTISSQTLQSPILGRCYSSGFFLAGAERLDNE